MEVIFVIYFSGMNFFRVRFFGLTFFVLVFWLLFISERDDFWPFIFIFSIFFGGFWVLFFSKFKVRETEISGWIGLAVLLRFIAIFFSPNFSDDYFRFLWDGLLISNGIHPFAFLPSQIVENQNLAANFPPALFENLNSKNYFSVYPPVCQFVFATVAKISDDDVWMGVFLMKIFILLCEIGSLFFLWKLGKVIFPKNKLSAALPCLIYGLHPLPIFENVGNCHFESAMIFFLLATVFHLQKKEVVAAAMWFSLAVATKLLPLIFLPLFLFFLDKKLIVKFLGVFVAATVWLFYPIWETEMMLNATKSLDLYFQKFEFNASIYYLIRELGFWQHGYNLGYKIAPFLAAATGVVAIWMAIFKVKKGDFRSLLICMTGLICLYFLGSATVHPWYLTLPLAFSGLVGWRFPIVWAGTAVFSYSHYQNGQFLENYWLIGLEYGLVAAAFWFFDLKNCRNQNFQDFRIFKICGILKILKSRKF